MFIAIYRWTLKPGTKARFETDWAEVTRAAVANGGSLGSALGRAADGSWVAVARWPSKEQATNGSHETPPCSPPAPACAPRCNSSSMM
jgi:heme-degrading monooxygenase HmoA